MEVLSKVQLLQGKEYREEQIVEEMGGKVILRPLTSREWMDIQIRRAKSLEDQGSLRKARTGDVKMDLGGVMNRTFDTKCEMVSQGLVEPALSPAEVGELKISILNFLFTRISVLSGVEPEAKEEISSFRKK